MRPNSVACGSISRSLQLVLVCSVVLVSVLGLVDPVSADVEPNNNIGAGNGGPVEALASSPVTGLLSAPSDLDDVYAIFLAEGQTLDLTLVSGSGAPVSMMLFGPGTTDVMREPGLVGTCGQEQFPKTVSYTVPKGGSGLHFVDVWASGDSGSWVYTLTCTVAGSGGGGGGQPVIACSPASLTFFATQGGVAPGPQTLSISNSGAGTLAWSATDDASWLDISPTTGTDAGSIAVAVDLTGLAQGSHTGRITITAPGAQTVTVLVTLQIRPPAGTASFEPSTARSSAAGGDSSVMVTRSGEDSRTPLSVRSNASWISVRKIPKSGPWAGTAVGMNVSDDGTRLTKGAGDASFVLLRFVTIGSNIYYVRMVITSDIAVTDGKFSYSGSQGSLTGEFDVAAGTVSGTFRQTVTDKIISGTWQADAVGGGIVRYSVAPNTSTSARTGTMTIGGYTYTVMQDGSGGQQAAPPSAILSVPAFSTSATSTLHVQASWASAGGSLGPGESFDVQYRPSTSGEWITWLAATEQTSGILPVQAGRTYQLRVRTRTVNGQGAWSAVRSVVVPYDQSVFTWRGRWSTRSDASAFLGAVRSSDAKGASCVSPSIRGAKRITLIASMTPSSGRAAVYINDRLARTIDLYASSPRHRVAIPIKSYATARTVKVRVVVLRAKNAASRGYDVTLDGLAIAR